MLSKCSTIKLYLWASVCYLDRILAGLSLIIQFFRLRLPRARIPGMHHHAPCCSSKVKKSNALPLAWHFSIFWPREYMPSWGYPASTTNLLSELHPCAGDGLGTSHFPKQLHRLSCSNLLVLRELDDLRGHS